ncbi:MAG: hypothetical protein KDB32_07400 [Planctomycetes bacterium]|nr:hypothetical protein [Planctomycetota bacterium]
MSALIEGTTSLLIERARGRLIGELEVVQKTANRSDLEPWFGGLATGAGVVAHSTVAKVEKHTDYYSRSTETVSIVAGLIALGSVVYLFKHFMKSNSELRVAAAKAQALYWLKFQAHDGLLNDTEERTEIRHLML